MHENSSSGKNSSAMTAIPCREIVQQAARPYDPVSVIRQEFVNGRFSYIVDKGGSEFRLDSTGLTCQNTPHNASILVPEQVVDVSVISNRDNPGWSRILPEVTWYMEPFFRRVKTDSAQAVALYVLATYSFKRSCSLPTLWLYVPQPQVREVLGRVLEMLCFNGALIYPYHRFELVLAAIQSKTPTLIFLEPERGERAVRESLLEYANSTSRSFPTSPSESAEIFCPKIVVSGKLPNDHLRSNSIVVFVPHVSEPNNPPLGDCWRLRSLMVGFSLHKVSVKPNDSYAGVRQFVFPDKGHQLRDVLATLSPVLDSASEIQSLASVLETHSAIMGGHHERSFGQEILIGVKEFLDALPHRGVPNSFVPLEAIVNHMRENNEVLEKIDPKVLSQELGKWPRLIVDRRRVLMEVTIALTKGTTTKKVQRTCVKIDTGVLNKLLWL